MVSALPRRKAAGEPPPSTAAIDGRAPAASSWRLAASLRVSVKRPRAPPAFSLSSHPLHSFRPGIAMKTVVPLDRAMFTFLGLEISGDLADYTMWRTRRGRLVCYPRTVPGKPPSPAQQAHRARFAQACAAWAALPASARSAYEEAAKRCSLPMTGHNLWIRWTFTGDLHEALAIQSFSGLSFPLPARLN